MASADPKNELECSICMNIYTDPVTLKCGHNFCRDCIGCVLDTQEGSGGYSCPECREEFQERPALHRNITLNRIEEDFLSALPDQEEFGVLCTYCFHTPVSAVISCLLCEASLCGNHLRVHSKSPEHVLCDLTTYREKRKCSVHKEQLKYYCTEDSTCICVSCSLAGEHQGHQVETLDEASKMRKKKLRNVLQKLMTEREETEKKVQSLQEHRRKVQGKADDETGRVTALFRDLRRHLEGLEKRVLSEISEQAERVSLSLSDLIQQLEIKKKELSRKIYYIEELCNMTDPLTVLQKSDTHRLCDAEDGNEDREGHDKLLHNGGDLDLAGISHTLHTGLSDIMSGVNVQKCTDTPVHPHSTTKDKGHVNAGPSRRRHQPYPAIQHSHHQVGGPNIWAVQQTLGVTEILLDVNTAGSNLLITEDRKTAYLSLYENHPKTLQRFLCPQVMSSQCFYSGHHYVEVDVGRSANCIVGVCYSSITRWGDESLIGNNCNSWGLHKNYNQFSVIHGRKAIQLASSICANRFRIYLDYEAGRISFYEMNQPIKHLYTFTTTFYAPLYAVFGVWEGCIMISGGNQI